jgi:hypothetical protein
MANFDFLQSDIRIKIKNNWLPTRDYQKKAFIDFKNNNEQKYEYNQNGIQFTICRVNDFILFIREDGTYSPIANWSDVKVFLLDRIPVKWYNANNYQTWAYFDYIYNNQNKNDKTYISKNTDLNNVNTDIYVILPFDDINPNIIFKLSKNHNDFIYLENNKTKIIISDNKLQQDNYYYQYYRLIDKTNWFESAFGFTENYYNETKDKINQLYNNHKINHIDVGNFRLINLNQIYDLLSTNKNTNFGIVSISNIIADIKDLHKKVEIDQSTIQVASQLNCLEIVNPNVKPEDGITIYQNDKTQGPICVMCTPAGIAYRNYLYDNGQKVDKQIDMSRELLYFLQSYDKSINWQVINGYLFVENIEMLKKINLLLLQDQDIRRIARRKILAGIHNNLGIYIDNKSYDHHVNHVLCSGIPISYHQNELNNTLLWDGLAELFLEAYYEITLLITCYNNIQSGLNKPCYLTKVGGGVFGMKKNMIIRAINRACNIVKNLGYSLTVYLVHYGSIEPNYEIFDKLVIPSLDNKSIWDDTIWILSNFS